MDDRTGSYTAFQEGAERFASARNGIPDRIPVYAQMHQFVRKELGVSAKRFYSTPDILVKGTLETTATYGIDVPLIDYDVYNIEAEALGQKIIYDDQMVPEIDRSAPLLQHRSDLNKIKTPNFNSDGRLPMVLEMYALFQDLTGLDPVLSFCAPFSLAANIRGLEPLLNDLDDAPGFAADLFECLTENVLAPWIGHLKKRFPNAKGVCGNDAFASLPIVSPSIIRNWIIPYILRLRELCGADVYVPNWVGEAYLKKNPEAFLDCKLQVCPTFIEGQDPDVAELGPAFYKNYATRKGVALVLGIGAGFLAFGSEAEVAARVRHYAAVGGKNGRFALYLCNLDAGTPPGNIKAVVDALKTV
jgi:uroporphyrinogen-III decarboxylase